MPRKLNLANPIEACQYWSWEETGRGIMEAKLSGRQGQRGQNCHVVLSGCEL